MEAGSCLDCGEIVVNLFADDEKRLTCLPSYCLNCEALWIDGHKTVPADSLKAEFRKVAEVAAEAGEQAKAELLDSPEDRIQKYFERVFKWAFTEGFVRSYVFLRHNMKEGRLRRIRGLWEKGEIDEYKGHFTGLTNKEFRELDKLIRWTK